MTQGEGNNTFSQERENSPWLEEYRDNFAPGIWVLDLGCGTGHDAVELADFGCRVVALDLDPCRVARVPNYGGIRLRVAADLTGGLPFRSECFDCVVASLSLHYFDARATHHAIEEVARVLNPHGQLVCRVNAAGDWNFGYRQGTEVEPNVFRQPDGRLKRFFDRGMVEKFFERCFTVDRVVSRTILQHGREKQTLECVATKR